MQPVPASCRVTVSPPAISVLVRFLTNQKPLSTEEQSPDDALRNAEGSFRLGPALNAFDAPVYPLRWVILLTLLTDGETDTRRAEVTSRTSE